MENIKRVVVYVPQVQHRELKVVLAKEGTSVSDWFRTQVDLFLSSPKKFSKKIPEEGFEAVTAKEMRERVSIPVTGEKESPTTFKLCKAKFCNNYAEDGDFCKEHKNG